VSATGANVKKAEKIGNANDEKGGEQAEKARYIVENEKQDSFPLLMFDSDVQYALLFLISLMSTKHELL